MPITNKTYPFKLIAIISFGCLGFSHGSFLSDDEFMSQLNCTAGLSVCSDLSQCIPSTYLCDGRMDCEDGSDEKWTLCYYRKFNCADNTTLIRASLRCDGRKNCLDGSDEEGCRRRTKNQLTNIFVSKAPILPSRLTTTPEPVPTLSSTFSMDEEEIAQSTIGSVNNSIAVETEEEKDHSLAVDSLLMDKEEEVTLGFLNLFCFWLAVAIGGLAGLAFTTAVLMQGSTYIKKRRCRSVNLGPGSMPNQSQDLT
ncbi:uncharacterized protein LOC124195889 isoform X1 [Daphnia pulex]|uniref:uncharacterized protein LOC124195889 isoform X1 n=2 Tax=Daphnia pulex TaxID=6669 RepID=UPI001EDD4005|nr:uncharacterized protein LOC124195889 isoform X1 [Daphnia pulex]